MTKIELMFVPTPGMGHLLSTVEFAKLIIRGNADISIVVLIFNLPSHSSTVNAYVESQSSGSDPSRLTFLFLTHPSLSNPPGSPFFGYLLTLIDLHKPLVKQAVEDRAQSGSPKPAGFVLDMFCTSLIDVANELNIPSYVYFTSGAGVLNVFLHFQSMADDSGVDVIEFNGPDIEFDIPGFRNQVPCKVIPGIFLDKEKGFKFVIDLTRGFRKSNGILLNTFMELESYTMQKMLDLHDEGKLPAVYPVGPILDLNSSNRGGFKSRKEEEDQIMQWLDQQPDSSVVFLCFGSMGTFDAPQVQEIANALDRVGHRFLWSLRRPPPENKRFETANESEIFEDALPEGFLERTGNRGKIIGWAPQVAILGHRATGGFVSHCGWNSTLESIWFGVPMATWPLYAEQQTNAFQLVKELGIAVEIRMDYRRDWKTKKYTLLVTSDEIESGVNKLMSMDEETKEKVRKMSEKGKKALDENGSSHHWLGCFIADVLNKSSDK